MTASGGEVGRLSIVGGVEVCCVLFIFKLPLRSSGLSIEEKL